MCSIVSPKMGAKPLNLVMVPVAIIMIYGSTRKTEAALWWLTMAARPLPKMEEHLNGWSSLSLKCTTPMWMIRFPIMSMATGRMVTPIAVPVIHLEAGFPSAIGGPSVDVSPDLAFPIPMIIISSGPDVMTAG